MCDAVPVQVECKVPVDEPIFQPFPPEVTFHNYEAFQTYEATLYLRNNDNVSRRVKVLPMESPYFSVRRAAATGKDDSKVATGMEVAFVVTFRPESRDDYSCDLVVCTEREKFVVPVLAVGASAALDFPDLVEFGSVPAKVEARQTVFVRNVGSKAAHFSLSAPQPFTVSPTAGNLAPDETLQCTVTFEPPSVGRYEGELEIQYDSGRCVYAQLLGNGTELDVGVSQGVLTMLSTFVTKSSQKTFKIVNNSDSSVTFSVKQRSSAEQDMAITTQRLNTLTTSSPRANHRNDEDAIFSSAAAQLSRRLHKAQREALLDAYLFTDRSFTVNPVEGTIWPRGEVEVVVTFSPDHARDYEVTAYVDVAGRADRLPVVFKGRGLGPAAVFSYDVLDLGDTWVNTLHQYEVELQNRGKIDVEYRMVPPGSPFGSRFTFEPASGRLAGGQIQVIKVKLLSDLLGAFDETFSWQIRGSSEPLSLQFRGRVCAPSFEVDEEALDFGVCSYGFRYTKEFTLTNTSEIPLRFLWRVPTDHEEPREFQILPAKGTILPHGRVKINVEFISRTVQRYRTELVMDIPGVAERQLVLPLTAECAVPKLSLYSRTLEFGECSLRYPYKQEMRIVNESKLPAKFEVLPQEPNSLGLATFTVEPSSGGIPARGEQAVELTLTTYTLGRIQIPVRIKALGSKGPPLELILNAKTITPTIAFDKVPVLKEHSLPLTINNISAIPADFKLFIESKDSVFSVEPRQAHLEPGESCTAHVIVKMDESMDFSDTLHVLIQEGADMPVPLTASGTGSAILAEELSSGLVDFGYQFVGRPFSREVTVYNLGRKGVLLAWTSARFDELKRDYARAHRGSGKKFDLSLIPPETHPVFNISPDKVQLGPKEAATFAITGNALVPGEVREQLVCSGTFGNSNKSARRVFETFMRADVATPLLHFSERLLHFRHVYKKGMPVETQTRPLTIKNISPLPLTFALRPSPPFAVDRSSWTLEVEESGTVNVTFDPNFKEDLQSIQTRTKLQVLYVDNPQRDAVDLHGDIDFPNLSFENHTIDFGSVLLDTTRRVPVRVTNTSNVDVVYSWAWDKGSVQEDVNSVASMSLRQGRPKPPPTQLFDVMPIRGVLRPGEAETMTFSFFAYPGVKASCSAVCQVEGGPAYTVHMSGESNNIKYSVEPQLLDFGIQLYDRTVERELTLSNSGKVPFTYTFNFTRLSRPGIVEAVPVTGTVAPLTKETVKIRVCPGIPDKLVETLLVEVAHFEPVPIQILVEGAYASVSINLPRVRDEQFMACVEKARLAVINAAVANAADEANKPGEALSSEKRVEVEAERLRLIQQLLEREVERRRQAGRQSVSIDPARRAARLAALQPPLPALAVSHYVLDFGYVVKGLTRTRKFRITNTGTQQVSFRFEKGLLEVHGFKVDPEVVARLPGAPDYGFVDVAVTMQANKSSVQPGPLELIYPLNIKGSPPVLLTLRAHVQMPDMRMSTEILDFGSCLTGQCKVFTVQLHNQKQVPCEFSIKRPAEVIKAKDWQFFVCEPSEGTLEPDQRLNLKVIFTPVLNRDAPYSQGIPIRINLNNKVKELQCTGRGLTPKVTFNPNFVDCGPILPFFEGQAPNEAKVTMSNPCPFPIEVVSLDFDPRYAADEEALRVMEGYNENGILYLPPLHPGDALWPEVVEAAEQRKRMEAAAAEAQAAADAAAAAGVDAAAAAAGAAAVDGVGSLEAVAGGATAAAAAAAKKAAEKAVVLVVGPHLAGKTTQARRLGVRYGVPVVQLDEMLLAAADLEPPTAEELAAAAAAAPPPPPAEADSGDASETAAELAAAVATDSAPPPPPPFDMEISDLLFDKVLMDPDFDGQPDYVPPHTRLTTEELYGLVVRGLRHLLAHQPTVYGKGLVLDGLASRYLPPAVAAKALLEALGMEQVVPPPPPPPEPVLDPKAAKKTLKKGEEPPPPPPPPPPKPTGWRGPYTVHVVHLAPEPTLLAGRLRLQNDVRAAEAMLADKAGVEAEGELSAGPSSLLGGVAPADSPTQVVGAEASKFATGEGVAAATAAVAGGTLSVATRMPAAATNEAASASPSTQPPAAASSSAISSEEAQRQYLEEATRLLAEFNDTIMAPLEVELGPSGPDNVVVLRRAAAEGSEDKVHKAVVGLGFRLGVLSTALPSAQCDAELVPPRYAMQIVPRPRPRPARTPVQRFKIFTFIDLLNGAEPPPPPPPPPPPAPPSPTASGRPKGSTRGKKGAAVVEEPPPPPPPPPTRKLIPDTRWVIPAGGSVELLVQFASPEVGKVTETLAFEVLGGERLNTLVLTGTCDYPHISTDYRNVFYKKVKARPQTPLIRSQYIISRGVFEFGPLLHSKDATGYLEGAHPDNTARIRITNNGLFDNHVEFMLNVFLLHPQSLDLKVDETQELVVYAFPKADGLVEDVIVCRIKDNPTPVEFPISVIGAKPQVQFERLLVNKKDIKTFTITNPGLLPIKWRLNNLQAMPKEFTVYPQSGEIPARSDIVVTVEFSAMEKRVCEAKLVLEVLDAQELQGVAHSIPLPIKGEAYKIEIDINFPQVNFPGVDYGTLRVVDDVAKSVAIKNTGKYAIAYNYTMKPGSALQGLLTITPSSGTIDPGKDAKIEMAWNKDKNEVTLVGNSDVTLSIIEPLTTNREDTIPIQISARAVFSKYAVTPARGIHFGPVTYNTASKPKVVEITNLGQFEFRYRLFNYANGLPAATPPPAAAGGGKGASVAKPGKAATLQPLAIGPFTFDPQEGVIPPGGRKEVAAVFNAAGASTYSEVLGIDISERDFADQPSGIPIEVAGESCIPGIDAENTVAIFEEHVISPSLDPFNPINNEFSTRERVFNFGAPLPSAAAASHAVRANLKFINPVKVPCVVNFTIKPRGNLPPGVCTAFPMEVSPAQLVIPPLEYRYTAIYFAPRAIQSYVATLEAVVENGGDPKTKSFSCEVRGEGTLPSLAITEPTVMDTQGRPVLRFPRLLRGRSSTLRIALKNNGILPAKARLDMAPHPSFRLEGAGGGGGGGSGGTVTSETLTVESKRGVSYNVVFTPADVGPVQHEVHLRVANNPFEDYRFLLTGEGYQEDVTFDMLPNDALDVLRLQDGPVGRPVTAVFALRNHSAVKNFRFRWPAPGAPSSNPHLTVSPAVGHLLAGSSKDITLTFSAAAPVKLQPHDIKVALMQINHAAGTQPVDWDDRSVVVDYGLPPGPNGQPLATPEPEPPVTDVAGSTRELVLHVHACADNAKYSCEAGPIVFKPTMMFQTRSYTFPLTNTSAAHLDYKFTVMQPDGVTVDEASLFTISPAGGVIEAGQTAQITVKFAPTEVEDCNRVLVCQIPHLDPSCPPLARPMAGRVLRPWAHFELPDSDYVSAGRRSPDMPGPSGSIEPLDPATRVVEVESLGVRVRNTKRFFVLNPTGIAYEFFWDICGGGGGGTSSSSPFTCLTRRGVIGGGRRFEMVFEYTPTHDAVVESFWRFRIPEQGIEVPFLLVGLVSEPRVVLDRPSINFGQILMGCKGHGTVTLLNNEHLPFQFAFDKGSYDATDELIKATGNYGVVPAQGSVAISATFTPRLERDINYNVQCVVKNKPSRLVLNIKGEGTAIHEALQLENADGTTVLLAPRQPNAVDFGQVLINERCVKALAFVNSGQVNFNFVWDVGTNPRITIHPESGTVPRGERLMCEIAYNPHGPDKLQDYKVTCQIVNGPKYTLLLNGVGHKPRLDLSWFNHDFGLQPVWQPGMAPAVRPLRLRNDDSQPIAVDPHWDAAAPGAGDWQVDCGPLVLQPGESREWVVTFKPHAAVPAVLSLPLEINGLYTVHVEARGEGSPLRVEVANPAHRAINFGPVAASGSATRVVPVTNRGRTTVTLNLGPSAELLARCAIDVIPGSTTDVLLRPRETTDLTFFFRPTARMRPFTEELLVSLCGVTTPLATLTGACLGTELRLASDSLPFGPVVLGSRVVKRLQLENTGDVGTKFAWDVRGLGPHFSIFPAEGFLAPGQDVKLDVAFHPTEVNPDIRVDKVRLRVEGGTDCSLTLTGACIASAAQPEVVSFACNVRASANQSITITNASSSTWSLRPVIQNDFFSGPESLTVPANGKASYTITFRPLTMSSPDQPHEGSVFFPIPDGTGLLYRLVGRAEAPVPEGVVERHIQAKSQHTEVFKCHNWLHRPQRFHVLVERKTGDKSTQLLVPEYVDVPALSSKDVKMGVMSFTASTTQAVVKFKNEATGEYLFYDCKFTAAPPAQRGTLSLECPVRTQTTARVSVANPLPEDVTLRGSATNKHVQVPASTLLRAGSTTEIEVRYRPLVVGHSEALFRLDSPELGLFEWALKLAGTPTNPERSLAFNVPLGGRETQIFRFTHWLDERAEYKVSFKSSGTHVAAGGAFTAAASVVAPPAVAGLAAGSEASLDVHFEPTAIGENIRDTLVVVSTTGGEYQCPLVGRCIPPKPQGPVDVSKGTAVLPFTNVFTADAEFQMAVDNPAFVVKNSEKIASKKSSNIAIQYKPIEPGRTPKTGKLTISCPAQTSSQWVYYLQA
ncbi:hypothetical protein VOLCADRAFT_67248 [Volvox carteri f. nagariensis]|uniref:Uncharacterized protein n=1 Tax=Volvox carteri f. nagariensis TaxID=3068 RepID=D8UD91_VOLCA|nr:uncharacterized protein VOLCADRAFT_67248 [Volvox carteri f. nagariensis]EFJ42226.1 hypothetical protein VOLCADRAFT_67248 [Volvox carteri f. nagariensis]|eukprot:XP_002956624.1 hypothetical protein VOLCADRAFT_67248 [Volvox carteri f. nagariensis]